MMYKNLDISKLETRMLPPEKLSLIIPVNPLLLCTDSPCIHNTCRCAIFGTPIIEISLF